jgi:hypothetical protein
MVGSRENGVAVFIEIKVWFNITALIRSIL